MLLLKKGFDVIEGEELYHLIYNPFYNDWKIKKDLIRNNKKSKTKKSKFASFK